MGGSRLNRGTPHWRRRGERTNHGASRQQWKQWRRRSGRSQTNAAFADSSFLFGGNAAYIEQLYAAYKANPAGVDAEWREFFGGLNDDASVGRSQRQGRLVEAQRTGRSRRRATSSPRSTANGRSTKRRSPTRSRARPPARQGRDFRRRTAPRDPGFRARHHDDPRLSHARPSARQSRSARPRSAEGSRGAASVDLRLHRSRLRPQDLHRSRARPRIRDHPRDAGDLAPHLLLDHRLGVHAHFRSGRKGLDSGAHRGTAQGNLLHQGRQARHPAKAGRGRGLREIPRRPLHRHQAFRPRRRRSR